MNYMILCNIKDNRGETDKKEDLDALSRGAIDFVLNRLLDVLHPFCFDPFQSYFIKIYRNDSLAATTRGKKARARPDRGEFTQG